MHYSIFKMPSSSSAPLCVLSGRFSRFACLAIFCLASIFPAHAEDFQPIRYRNPGLEVDLGVGLWPVPLPMDYDRDGDLDLLVSTSNKPSGGIYLFENRGGM